MQENPAEAKQKGISKALEKEYTDTMTKQKFSKLRNFVKKSK